MVNVLGFCEVHWRPVRGYALEAARAGSSVQLAVRGPIVPDVLPIVPPQALIRWVVIPRTRWKLWVLWHAARRTLADRRLQVVCDRPRLRALISQWVPWARRRCTLIQ